jgi:hypothetical protein
MDANHQMELRLRRKQRDLSQNSLARQFQHLILDPVFQPSLPGEGADWQVPQFGLGLLDKVDDVLGDLAHDLRMVGSD